MSFPLKLTLIEFQLEHYKERLEQARSFKEKIFLRKELHNLKMYYQAIYK